MQRRARLDPEVVDERPPGLGVCVERVRLPVGTVAGKQLPQTRNVQLVDIKPDAIAAVRGRDRVMTVASQGLAKLGDVNVDRLPRRRRRRLTPELVDQPLARDELVRMQEQGRQDEPLLQPAQRDRLALVDHLEWPEDPVLHRQVLPLPKPKRKHPEPGLFIRLRPPSYLGGPESAAWLARRDPRPRRPPPTTARSGPTPAATRRSGCRPAPVGSCRRSSTSYATSRRTAASA